MAMPRKMENEADRERKRAYDREWYKRHSRSVRARNDKQREKLHRWYEEYKASLACMGCGENHPATLVFHHRDPAEKEFTIAAAVHDGWSVERIMGEMRKCDILCANCHMRLHNSIG